MTTVPVEVFIDDVIAAIRQYRADPIPSPFPYERLAGYPKAAVLAMTEFLEDAEIVECGVSLRTGWVRDYLPDIEQRIAAFKEQARTRWSEPWWCSWDTPPPDQTT